MSFVRPWVSTGSTSRGVEKCGGFAFREISWQRYATHPWVFEAILTQHCIRNMPTIHYILHDGTEHALDALPGDSVMIIAKDHDLQGILAECGGACSCATCHVRIDPSWVDRLPPKEDLEEEMLEFVEDADETSRLSCQLRITEDMDGLIVHVPENQY